MSTEAAKTTGLSTFEQLRLGRDVVRTEGRALLGLAERLQDDFCRAVDVIHRSSGSVIVCGMGKAGLIGQKIAATLASTGTRSHFLHPADAIHGDLGRVHQDDVLLVLSYSGATEEIVRLLPLFSHMDNALIAVTGGTESPLAEAAGIVLSLGSIEEACPLGLAPTTSTTAMLAIGDALALVLSRMRHFGREDFARFHPGGSLGRKLMKVDEAMRPISDCRVGRLDRTVREILVQLSRPGRRCGAIMVVDAEGSLAGIFTDSDLARLLERKQDEALDRPVHEVMTKNPRTVSSGELLDGALGILAELKLSELPVIDSTGAPVGMIDITDVVAFPAGPDGTLPPSQNKKSAVPSPHTISFPNRCQGLPRK